MNPYLVLGVPVQADDPTIRRAYLEAIKQATPEKNPTRFQSLSEAYERIKDESSRCQYEQQRVGSDLVRRHWQWERHIPQVRGCPRTSDVLYPVDRQRTANPPASRVHRFAFEERQDRIPVVLRRDLGPQISFPVSVLSG